jgi:hypothetical protein
VIFSCKRTKVCQCHHHTAYNFPTEKKMQSW